MEQYNEGDTGDATDAILGEQEGTDLNGAPAERFVH